MAGLTAAQKQQFEEDGCLTVEGVLTSEEVETLRRACGEVEEMAQGLTSRTPAIHPRILPSGRRVVDIVKGAVFQHPQFLAACTHPGVLDIIESLVGPEHSAPPQQAELETPATPGADCPGVEDRVAPGLRLLPAHQLRPAGVCHLSR